MVTERVELFAEFVALRSPALQRTAYLVACDVGLAQDLVHEALTRTCVAWPRLRDPHRAEDFARTAIVREAVRREQRRRGRPEPPAPMPVPPVVPAGPAGARDDPVGREDPDDPAARLWLDLSLLPVRQRAAIVLRHHQELTEREIAEVLGCAVRTAERELAAGLDALRRSAGPEVPSQEAPR